MNWLSVLIALFGVTGLATCANILAIFPVPSFSHQQFYRVYAQELHRRGHNLTIATPNPIKHPNMTNYREIDLSGGYKIIREVFDVSSADGRRTRKLLEALFVIAEKLIYGICHLCLSNDQLMDIYRRNEKFDLYIVEWGMMSCVYPFAKLADGKMIGVGSFALASSVHVHLGTPTNPAHLPEMGLDSTDHMTFTERLRSTIAHTTSYLFFGYLNWQQGKIVKKYFGSDVGSITDIEKNVSLIFDNSHPAMNFPRPGHINYIPLGGPPFHLNGRKAKPLPKDIQEFMDGAEHGVIYFSLGTNVQTSNMSTAEEEVLLESFKRMPQRILWKWENEKLKVNLGNVKVGKWFPQTDVLAHPKVKAFVTQGGLQSVGEAIENHVPMIIMPFFADQNQNAQKMTLVGVAKTLSFDNLKVNEFTEALNEIINDPKYKHNVIEFSKLIKDQPMPPLEKAVWWTEYVLRHNGAPHLRSAAVTMPWYQYFMLDVLAAALLIFIVIIYIVYLILRSIVRLIFKSEKTKKE